MASDILFGRKPAATGDVGVGELAQNETRLTWLATPSDDYWVTHVGAHVGWDGGGTPPLCTIAVYTTANELPDDLYARSPAFRTRAIYQPFDPYGGENVQYKLAAPVIFRRNWSYHGGLHTAERWMTHGMSNSGAQMSRDYGNTAPPAQFTIDQRDAQGQLAMWAVARRNSPPAAPSGVSPEPNGQTTDTMPVIAGNFRDPDETLTGFGVGGADQMDAYQIIVYNRNKTVRIWQSGVVIASSGERANRRFARSVSTELAPGEYTVWARVRDRCGAWSNPTEWRITVAAGGSVTVKDPQGRITDTTPTMTFDYTHRQGLSLASVDVQVVSALVEALGGGPIHGPVNVPKSVASGSAGVIEWSETGFSALGRGVATAGHVLMRPIDANGVAGAWSARNAGFHVNAIPGAPSNLSPASGDVRSTRGVFRMTGEDDQDRDAARGFTAKGYVKLPGDTVAFTEENSFPMAFVGMSGSRAVFEGAPSPAQLPDYTNYQWMGQFRDQYGDNGWFSSVVSFTYAEPPAITVLSPTSTDVTTATPTVTFTSDPSAAKQRVRWIDAATRETVRDSGLVTASGSDRVVSGEIRNNRAYDIVIGVQTGLGIYGEVVRRVNVAFTTPPAPADQRVELHTGVFDIPDQPTVAAVRWTGSHSGADGSGPVYGDGAYGEDVYGTSDPAALIAPEEDFHGYGIYRRVNAGPVELIAVIPNRSANTYMDDTAPLNATLAYWVTQFEDEGLDIVESDLPETPSTLTMRFGGTIITDVLNPSENRVVARYWLSREETPVRARAQREGWGQFPIVFYGERQYVQINGVWDVIHETGFTATELKDAMIRLTEPVLEEVEIRHPGVPSRTVEVLRPRRVCYRDGRGRVYYGNLEIEKVEDTHREPYDVSWRFVETSHGMPPVERPSMTHQAVESLIDILEGILGKGSR